MFKTALRYGCVLSLPAIILCAGSSTEARHRRHYGGHQYFDMLNRPVAPADAARKSRYRSTEVNRAEPRENLGRTPKGPLQVVVSIGSQRVTLYDNGVRVAQGPVSLSETQARTY
jgi:hypothetical protein